MSAHDLLNFYPVIALIGGLSSAIHCSSMCGGLVLSLSEQKKSPLYFSLGRLFAYILLSIMTYSFGNIILMYLKIKYLVFGFSLLIGFLYIFWGIKAYLFNLQEIKMPNFMEKMYAFFFTKSLKLKCVNKAFIIGLMAIFLPCGILYSFALSLLGILDLKYALVSIFFFWVGTLPAIMIGPSLIKKLLAPIKSKIPKIYPILLICIGVITISFRFQHFYEHNFDIESIKDLNCH